MTLSPTLTNPTVDYRRKRRRRASQETQLALAFGFAVAAPTALYLATGAPLEWHTAGDIVTGLLAHGLLITVGYGLSEGVDPITETMSLLGIGDMVWAYVSMALFVLVVVSSLVVVKRKLPREFWMGVHFY